MEVEVSAERRTEGGKGGRERMLQHARIPPLNPSLSLFSPPRAHSASEVQICRINGQRVRAHISI